MFFFSWLLRFQCDASARILVLLLLLDDRMIFLLGCGWTLRGLAAAAILLLIRGRVGNDVGRVAGAVVVARMLVVGVCRVSYFGRMFLMMFLMFL
jgi:hypothetical protein